MLRSKQTLTALLVLLAIAVAVATAVAILMLPAPGTVRWESSNPKSSLAQLRSSLVAIGITQPTGTIQNLVRRDLRPLAFRSATYWSGSDVASRRADYLAAGGILALALLIAAFVLDRRPEREPAPTSQRRPRSGQTTQSVT
jgi:hypothetical protein